MSIASHDHKLSVVRQINIDEASDSQKSAQPPGLSVSLPLASKNSFGLRLSSPRARRNFLRCPSRWRSAQSVSTIYSRFTMRSHHSNYNPTLATSFAGSSSTTIHEINLLAMAIVPKEKASTVQTRKPCKTRTRTGHQEKHVA